MEESSEQQCVSYEESGSRKVFIWQKINKNIRHIWRACFGYVFLKLYIIMLGQAYIPFYSYTQKVSGITKDGDESRPSKPSVKIMPPRHRGMIETPAPIICTTKCSSSAVKDIFGMYRNALRQENLVL